jgi:hypothetical protein
MTAKAIARDPLPADPTMMNTTAVKMRRNTTP